MAIDAQLTREFFELSGFRVQTHWSQSPGAVGSVQIFVENAQAPTGEEAPLLLTPRHLGGLERALVEIRAWHTDRLYASLIESNPILTLFAKSENALHAQDYFRGEAFKTILVGSELPSNPEQRARAIVALEESPVDHLIEFPTLLRHLMRNVGVNGSYAASGTLQLIQLMKRYRLIQHQQMEFQFPLEAPATALSPEVDAVELPPSDETKYEQDEWE